MILSDREITEAVENDLGIEPYNPEQVQPASYDISLGSDFHRFNSGWPTSVEVYDPLREEPETEHITVVDGTFILEPNEFALASTEETITLPDHLAATVTGRSSYGRCGLAVHITAGFIDPGFSGEITLELKNHNQVPLKLTPGEQIGQVVFKRLGRPCERSYSERDSQYQNQRGAQPARLHEASE